MPDCGHNSNFQIHRSDSREKNKQKDKKRKGHKEIFDYMAKLI